MHVPGQLRSQSAAEYGRVCLKTPQGADISEFLFHARRFFEGLPGVSQGKVTQQGAKRR